REKFRLMADDLPHSPQMRTGCCTASAPLARSCAGNRSGCPTIARRSLHSFSSATVDSLLCASINWLYNRHPLNGHSRQNIERYGTRCERLSPQEYYTTPRAISGNGEPDSKPRIEAIRDSRIAKLSWCSPVETEFAANNVARADFLRCNAWKWESAPTVFLLHSLMSASPTGYYRWAEKFNELGWNACFVHLPYHFSRVPTGYWNGELAITPDLIRNAEGLRQGVIELRQIMQSLREYGCREFGVLATSYGGWIGALLALVESDFR